MTMRFLNGTRGSTGHSRRSREGTSTMDRGSIISPLPISADYQQSGHK